MEASACAHQWSIVIYTHQGVVKRRWGNRHGEAHHPLSLHPCRDGWVCIASVTRPQWEGLCLAMDHPELLADDDLYVPAIRFDRADELDVLINGWTSGLGTAEVTAALQANHCPAGPVRTFADLLEDPHLAQRGCFVAAPHLGPTARMPGVPFALEGRTPPFRPAPGPGSGSGPPTRRPRRRGRHAPIGAGRAADAAPDIPGPLPAGPLAGMRVVELSVAWAGPLAGRFMADLGADVVKVEHPTSRGLSVVGGGGGASGGPWRWGTVPPAEQRNGIFPDAVPGERWWNRMAWFNKMNRGKRSLCLDVKGPGGRAVFEALVARADVVVNNYSPRGARSLGIDHPTLRAINPNLVTVDLTGFGAVGPGAEQVSWGPILDAASGFSAATGYPDSGPYKQGLALADAVGGVHGAYAILAALWEREVEGGPVHVDMSQLETMIGLAGELVLETSVTGTPPPRRGARSPQFAPAGRVPLRRRRRVAGALGARRRHLDRARRRRGRGPRPTGLGAPSRADGATTTSSTRAITTWLGGPDEARRHGHVAGGRRPSRRGDDEPRPRRGPAPAGPRVDGDARAGRLHAEGVPRLPAPLRRGRGRPATHPGARRPQPRDPPRARAAPTPTSPAWRPTTRSATALRRIDRAGGSGASQALLRRPRRGSRGRGR